MNTENFIRVVSAAALAFATSLAMSTSASAADGQYAKAEHNYNTYCVQCHGVNRNGKGINSTNMSVQPRDHSDAKGMADIPDSELFDVIKNGGLAANKSVLMPVWGNVMNDDEINEMVKYLRVVCKCGQPNK